MVEGGHTIQNQFLTAGLADEIHLMIPPFFIVPDFRLLEVAGSRELGRVTQDRSVPGGRDPVDRAGDAGNPRQVVPMTACPAARLID
ncbi:MAG TPA: dihydrofolate reductase family protein [Streptosporangiaceae bacterium]|nr:dihydrofolate reductase family protein [Streptosporangiaceae bacterium]